MVGKRLIGLAVATAIGVGLVATRADPVTTSTTITSATKMITNVGTALDLARVPVSSIEPVAGQVETRTFWSASLGRTMPYNIYLPDQR